MPAPHEQSEPSNISAMVDQAVYAAARWRAPANIEDVFVRSRLFPSEAGVWSSAQLPRRRAPAHPRRADGRTPALRRLDQCERPPPQTAVQTGTATPRLIPQLRRCSGPPCPRSSAAGKHACCSHLVAGAASPPIPSSSSRPAACREELIERPRPPRATRKCPGLRRERLPLSRCLRHEPPPLEEC
jgi:hypothetical protein